ncbi:Plasmodium vivax Vir protein, putative [Plasmodium vivax]|uniref:Vir protein, putative n=1 Tax=Plasmodium vivax TaxID=5855 RepID=A0A1G4E145_PLAVI|nr:Plasmodium vivax Vir protein, putative [Plasmodium vivax]
MACSNNSGEYLSYSCYSELKSYFNRITLSDDAKSILQLSINQLNAKPQNFNVNDNIFSELACHLAGDDAFWKYKDHVTCTYINFWLNNKIQNMYKYTYGSNFDFFLNFSKKFATERYNKNFSHHSCEGYLKDLGDEFPMRKTLYSFYDLYNELKKGVNKKTNKIPCDNISLIVSEYYNNKNSIEKNKDFQKQFKELKTIIQRESPFPGICNSYNKLDNVLPDEISPPKAEEHETTSHNLISEGSSRNVPHTNLGQSVDNRDAVDKSLLFSTVNSTQEVKLEEEMESLAPENPSEGPNEEQLKALISEKKELPTTLSQGEQEYTQWPPRGQLNTLWKQGTRFPGKESLSPDPKDYPREDTHTIRDNTGGVFGTIKESFINVLGDVDPVPVVGVSGGMGALFLLFRYTPVGTFFRGGRVRARRIPSGFSGPFLGEFPDIQYYYGGNIGYGQMNPLAE